MNELVRFLLIFVCVKLIASKPQHLQEQLQAHLDPLNEPQYEYPPKDPGKRTIFNSRHYALGKHIGVHPLGFKYVLGYSPINVKYVPVVKPVTVLKPVVQHSIKHLWKPVVAPTRHYLPPHGFHVHKPSLIHHVDHGWKPVVKPVVPVVPALPPPPPPPPVIEHPVAPVVPVKPVLPLPIKPPLHNYFFFQTPVAKPALLPQGPLLHLAKPHLGVLPLGATFPSPVLQHQGVPGLLHPITAPGFHLQAALPAPIHPHLHPAHLPEPVHTHLHPDHPHLHATHLPAPIHPHLHADPVHHHLHPFSVPEPVHPHPAPAAVLPAAAPAPPISVEFHGNHNLLPLQPFPHQFPLTAVQSSLPLPRGTVLGRQPHALPLPAHVVPEEPQHPQIFNLEPHLAPFNPEAAIQPGHTDLQVPLHLPDHPYFRQIHQVGDLEPPVPPFQNHGNILRPSISLEPPFSHGHV